MNDNELREYVKKEFVDSGFITVLQWRNFIDFLQILLNKEQKNNSIFLDQDSLGCVDMTKRKFEQEKI